jgi:DNA-binding MarR family transcriptional regulator
LTIGLASLPNVLFLPERIQIMKLLYEEGKASFTDLRDRLVIRDGNLVSYIRHLERADLVKYEKSFVGRYPKTIYSLTENGKKTFEEFREQMLNTLS